MKDRERRQESMSVTVVGHSPRTNSNECTGNDTAVRKRRKEQRNFAVGAMACRGCGGRPQEGKGRCLPVLLVICQEESFCSTASPAMRCHRVLQVTSQSFLPIADLSSAKGNSMLWLLALCSGRICCIEVLNDRPNRLGHRRLTMSDRSLPLKRR